MNTIYNRLNLPDSVSFPLQGNTMKLEYLADGRRVRTTAKTYGTPLVLPGGGSTPQNPMNILEEVRDGELVFRDGQLVELRTDGGWFSMWNDTLSTTQVRPYFYVTDYLGSVRMTVDGVTGGVEQSLEYLPSGYVCHSENYGRQPFRFCGKELVKMHGWDMYDSFARFQHDDLPRFTAMDPLAEKYYHASPYNYAGCDPVNAVDPSGEAPVYNIYGNFLEITKDGFTGTVLIYDGNDAIQWNELSESEVYERYSQNISSFDWARDNNLIASKEMVKIWNHVLSFFEGQNVCGHTFSMSSLYNGGVGFKHSNSQTWTTHTPIEGKIVITGSGFQPDYETSVENIAASLLYHEWYSHGIRLYDDPYNHSQAFLNVIQSPLWRTTTYSYKYYNYDMYDYYKEKEYELFETYMQKLKK